MYFIINIKFKLSINCIKILKWYFWVKKIKIIIFFFEQQNNTLYIGKYNIIVFLWGRINGLEFKRENLLSNQILKWN